MVLLGRRAALAAGVAIGGTPGLVVAGLRSGSASLVRDRIHLTSGARSGEVTTSSAVLWARASADARMSVRLSSNGRLVRRMSGGWADERTDHTARLMVDGLAPGRRYDAEVSFTAPDGTSSAPELISFSTAPVHAAAQSFVWSGDTCGQGFGINPDLGGLTAYRAMLDTRPDFFLHCGDTIYADIEIDATVREPTGDLWRNVVAEGVGKVAETLEEFRGRHRYPLLDDNVRALYAEVPTVSQWDDHETCNNWYPGEVLDDSRYTERSCDVLAARGRRAWQEYQPVPVRRMVDRGGDGYARQRIYRKVPRGQHLDLFVLDMRSYRGPNPTSAEAGQPGLLGTDQEAWLIREVAASTATWKVISADLPISAPSNHSDDLDSAANLDSGQPTGREPEIARVLSAFKRHGVRNVVWLTADVHYTAAYHYRPDRAAYTDFDPFWEFISGPVAAGTFSVKDSSLDGTFGPEVVYSKGNETTSWTQSPRAGNQFFGHVHIDADGLLTVTLYDGAGTALWSQGLEPVS
ncbi:alkaline phosphatase D family protein [Nocardioides mangrovi]|uniref:Alkaline phosphatase D family protein n=1 Tax=Nocardioides mangrovi TaxID=2874580 RepID=A0ABS7U9Q2_9ACTN|nr:alkaline phosphatase D family protein [Nocardioides mangrovi]MBZ5737711.1 alkaline phosphatase D family protein [Nocardioides mangrovi]